MGKALAGLAGRSGVNRRALLVAAGTGLAAATAGCLGGGFRDAPCPESTERVETTVSDRWVREAVPPEVEPPSDGDPAPHDVQLYNERETAVQARFTVRQTGSGVGCENALLVADLDLRPGAFAQVKLPYPDGYEVRVELPDWVGVFQTRADDYTCNHQGHEVYVESVGVEEISYTTAMGCPSGFL